jgi:RNAse (barnase) inhibitor barstar
MNKPTIIFHGERFSDLETFYDEVDKALTKNLDWKTGHNMDAFNDLLRGGFGVFEYYEPIKLVWTNFSLSRRALGESILDKLTEIIKDHKHIEFTTTDHATP